MTKEKQIEEMALAICEGRNVADVDNCRKCWQYENGCLYQEIAYGLYNAGYRKQSEGEWKTDKDDAEWGSFLKKKHCSICGNRPYFDKDKFKFMLTDFCPNCGAKMKGE